MIWRKDAQSDFAGPDDNLAHRLVEQAVKNDGRDNTTAMVVQVV